MNGKIRQFVVLNMMCFWAANALAYEFSTGKVFIRGVVGPTVNVVRFDDDANKATPGAGLVIGVETEYVINNPWSVIGGVRPSFTPGYVDLGFGIGAKYRWSDLEVPLIVSASGELTPAVLIPTSTGSSHFNLGVRMSAGVDYFLMSDLAVGLQVAVEPSLLWNAPIRSLEASIEFLAGMMYRI